MTTEILIDFVKKYRDMGLNVIPLKPKSKEPDFITGQLVQAFNEIYEGAIRPGNNLGVVCGKTSNYLAVLDLDSPDLFEYFKEYETFTVKTGKKGYHLYFRTYQEEATRKFKNSNNQGVDIKAARSFVAAPPSIHPDTKQPYEIVKDVQIMYIETLNPIFEKLASLGFNNTLAELKGESLAKGGVKNGSLHDSFVKYCNHLLFKVGLDDWHTYCIETDRWNQPGNNEFQINQEDFERVRKDCWKYFQMKKQQEPIREPISISKLTEITNNSTVTVQQAKESTPIFTELSEPFEYAQQIMKEYTFKTLNDTKEILVYQDGVFSYDGQTLIENRVQQLAGVLCSNRLVGEVIGHIKRSTPLKRELVNNDFSRIVLQDGILNLDTLEFTLGFDPEFITTIKIPVKYEPKATCPKFIKHLRDSLGSKENIIRVVEGMANILTANRKTFEMMYIFHGSGSNGKSLTLKIIRGVIGGKNCSSMGIHAVAEERFAAAHLDGKLVNLGGEISDNELNKTARLKQFTSYESIMVEKKGKDPFEMLAFAKHFYSTNKMPNIRDDTDSIYRRITTIKFDNQFLPGVNRIEDYDKEILQEEASGIFNLMLQNYKTLLRNKGFRHRQTIGEVREIMKNEADRLRQFVSSCLVLKCEGKFIVKDTMFEKIRDFFKSKEYDFEYSKQAMSLELVRLGLTDKHEGKEGVKKIDGKTVRVWLNVTWNMNEEWVKDNVKLEVKSASKETGQSTL